MLTQTASLHHYRVYYVA